MLSFGAEIPNEIHISALTELIYSSDFPLPLIQFSKVSRTAFLLSRDKQLWRQAIRVYFPVLESVSKESSAPYHGQFINDPYQLFVTSFKSCVQILKSNGLSFQDYVNASRNSWVGISIEKRPIIVGLIIASGQNQSFENNQLLESKNYAFLFSSALSNRSKITDLLTSLPPIERHFIRRTFVLACEQGVLPVATAVFSHAQGSLDRNSINEAFIKAVTYDHSRIVQIFLSPPLLQIVSLSLTSAFNIACAKGNDSSCILLMKMQQLSSNIIRLKEGLFSAINSGQMSIVQLLLLNPILSKNLLLMNDILKMAVEKGNIKLVDIILRCAQVKFSNLSILDSILKSMSNHNEDIAYLILESKSACLSAYAKRQLFYKACELGCKSVVRKLYEENSADFSKSVLKQGLHIASVSGQAEVMDYLCAKFEGEDLSKIGTLSAQIPKLVEITNQLERLSLNSSENIELDKVEPLLQHNYVKKTVIKYEDREANKNTTIKESCSPKYY